MVDRSVGWLVGLSVDWLVGYGGMAGQLNGWLVGWSVEWLVGWWPVWWSVGWLVAMTCFCNKKSTWKKDRLRWTVTFDFFIFWCLIQKFFFFTDPNHIIAVLVLHTFKLNVVRQWPGIEAANRAELANKDRHRRRINRGGGGRSTGYQPRWCDDVITPTWVKVLLILSYMKNSNSK